MNPAPRFCRRDPSVGARTPSRPQMPVRRLSQEIIALWWTVRAERGTDSKIGVLSAAGVPLFVAMMIGERDVSLDGDLELELCGERLVLLPEHAVFRPITEPKRTPPLAFPLLVDRTREAVSSESMADR